MLAYIIEDQHCSLLKGLFLPKMLQELLQCKLLNSAGSWTTFDVAKKKNNNKTKHFLLSILISEASLNTLTTCRNIFFHLICCSLLLPFLKPGYIGSDLRKTWSVIKQIISKKEPKQRFNNMKDSSGSYSNPTQIAKKFNNFFANVGSSLESKISPTQITYREFLIDH